MICRGSFFLTLTARKLLILKWAEKPRSAGSGDSGVIERSFTATQTIELGLASPQPRG
jgi:hypothetical protein